MKTATQKFKSSFIHMFDTHKEIKALTGSGIKPKQAESIVHLIATSRETDLSNLATKEQVFVLDKRMDRLESEMKEMMRWVIGFGIAILGTIVGMFTYILPFLKR